MEKIVKPVGKNILVERLTDDKTAGGLHLPDSIKSEKGNKVLAVGDDVKKVKKGNVIVFACASVAHMNVEGIPKSWFLISEDSVLAVIETK